MWQSGILRLEIILTLNTVIYDVPDGAELLVFYLYLPEHSISRLFGLTQLHLGEKGVENISHL